MISPILFKSIWAYRGFILSSVKREFQSKYRNSMLGAAWTVLNPLAMILVYTVIFAQVMRTKLPGPDSSFAYSIHLCSRLQGPGDCSPRSPRAGQSVFLEHANLIKKLSFPRICLPVIVVLNAGVSFAIIFGLFTCFLIVSGNFPGWAFLALIPIFLIQILFAIGLGITLGVLNVFFRDVGQFFAIFLQFWFWFTPIVYPATVLPDRIRPLLAWNPMVSIIAACQGVLVGHQWPQWETLLPVTLMAIVLCAGGLLLFRSRSGEMVDEL